MSVLDAKAADFTEETVVAIQDTGNDRLFLDVGKMIGTVSQTLEDAYSPEISLRIVGQKARAFLKSKIADDNIQ